MQAKLLKTRFGILYSLVAAVVALPSTSSQVSAGEGAFIVLPGEAPRYSGQQGREGDFTELLATADETGGVLGIFRQTIAPKSGPPTHLHGMEAEFCYVVSGQFNFKLGERIVSAPAGAFVFIPHNTPHTFQNIGTEPGIAVRCDARWFRKDVRGAARCGCRYEPEADGKAPYASRWAASSVGARLSFCLEQDGN